MKSVDSRYYVTFFLNGIFALLVSCTSVTSDGDGNAGKPLHLRVLATHDFHGALRPVHYSWSYDRPVGGALALKSVLDELETECVCTTIRVDSGDQMQGTLESNLNFGASVVAMFNYLDLDAAAVGNHELDWGIETLLTRQAEAQYPWLAANVFQVNNGSRPAWVTPYTIVEQDGIKVGIIGYATVSTPRTLRTEVTKPYEFRAGYDGIRDALDAVWVEKPDFVIIVAHAAGGCSVERCAGEMVELAEELPPGLVHMIAGGHAHSETNSMVRSIPIVRAGSNGRAIYVVDLYQHRDGSITFDTSRELVYADNAAEDATLTAILSSSLEAADAIGKAPVTTLAHPLTSSPRGDRRLGYLIADAVRSVANTDVGLHNPGGVRADLPSGVISYADAYRILPFDNVVVRLTLTGRQLRQLVNQTSRLNYFSNLNIFYDSNISSSDKNLSLSFSDSTSIEDDLTYTLATNDYLAYGGDNMTLLSELPKEVVGITVLDAFVEHLQTLPIPVVVSEVQHAVNIQ